MFGSGSCCLPSAADLQRAQMALLILLLFFFVRTCTGRVKRANGEAYAVWWLADTFRQHLYLIYIEHRVAVLYVVNCPPGPFFYVVLCIPGIGRICAICTGLCSNPSIATFVLLATFTLFLWSFLLPQWSKILNFGSFILLFIPYFRLKTSVYNKFWRT